MGLARVYPYTKFEVSSFKRSKDTVHVPLNWLDARGGGPKLAHGSPSFFYRTYRIFLTFTAGWPNFAADFRPISAGRIFFRRIFGGTLFGGYSADFRRILGKS